VKILCAVATFSRDWLVKKTYPQITPFLGVVGDYKYFVEPQQLEAYKKIIPLQDIIVTADNIKLGGQKAFIKQYALDDDVHYFGFRNTPKSQCLSLFAITWPNYKKSLENKSLGYIGVPYGRELFDKGFAYGIGRSVYFVRPELIETRIEFDVIEDIITADQAGRKGYPVVINRTFGSYLMVDVAEENKGGLGGGSDRLKRSIVATTKYCSMYGNSYRVTGNGLYQPKVDCRRVKSALVRSSLRP
jgi:hypothetical protein